MSGYSISIIEIFISLRVFYFLYFSSNSFFLRTVSIRYLQALQCLSFFSVSQPMLAPVMMLAEQSLQKTFPQKRQWCFQTRRGMKVRWHAEHLETSLSWTHLSLGHKSALILLAYSINYGMGYSQSQQKLLENRPQWTNRLRKPTLGLFFKLGALKLLQQQFSSHNIMEIQDEQPSPLSLTELLSDQQNRVKVVRILYQALTSMGFTESAMELQKQSEIYPEEEAELKIKEFLMRRQYREAESQLDHIRISCQKREQVQIILAELSVLQMIQQKDFEGAIEKVMEVWGSDQQKQLKFLSMIATDQAIQSEQFEKREAKILQHCTSESFELKKNIDIMLRGYLSSNQIEPKAIKEEHPYKKPIAESEKFSGLGKPTILKFSPTQDLICLVTENRHKEIQASIWMLHGQTLSKGMHWKQENFGSVSSLSWDQRGENISLCSQSKLGIFYAVDFKPKIILDGRNILGSKMLCCCWNAQGLLFVGGLANFIAVLDEFGCVVRTIRPFMKTREIIFSSNDQLYAISATRGSVIRYNVKQEKEIASFEAQHCFMSLYLNEKARTVVVTNKDKIYLLDSDTLQLRNSLISPNNEKMYKIEAFLVSDWLVIFNEKLTAVLQNHLVTRHHLWPDCDAVDVRGDKMVTAKSSLIVWQAEPAVQVRKSLEKNIYSSDKDGMEEVEWYSQELQQQPEEQEQMHSISSNSSSSSASEQSASSPIQEQNQIQIEYIQNEEDSSNQSQEV